MSNYMRRPPLLRRPAQVADPGEMVDLRVEDGSWRQGFRALCALDRRHGRGAHLGLHRGRVQGGSLRGPPCCGHEVAREADARISLLPPLALVLPVWVTEGKSAAK
jgi:hypothetical protein